MPSVYLIPSLLHDKGLSSIPATVLNAIRDCQVFFVENERTTRRYFKMLWKEMVIDDYEWHTIHKAEDSVKQIFTRRLAEGKNLGIVSEAGCPGIADPGQVLVAAAHQAGATIKPLVGPSSILLALMASGMNGQQFRFNGYLPIDPKEREQMIADLENESIRKNCTQIFIETPYRNNQMMESLLANCRASTRICTAVDLTSPEESVKTLAVSEWKKNLPQLHKRLVIFLMHG
jgi:16S rRNA (cytidine1402-2'-O)-methyltransferase